MEEEGTPHQAQTHNPLGLCKTDNHNEEPDFDDNELTKFVNGLVMYERNDAKGDEDDRKTDLDRKLKDFFDKNDNSNKQKVT